MTALIHWLRCANISIPQGRNEDQDKFLEIFRHYLESDGKRKVNPKAGILTLLIDQFYFSQIKMGILG